MVNSNFRLENSTLAHQLGENKREQTKLYGEKGKLSYALFWKIDKLIYGISQFSCSVVSDSL